MENMNERLRWARVRAGYRSARSAAAAMGMKPSTYAAHDNGQNRFDEEIARRYGDFFGVSWIWLLHGTGDPGAQISREQNVVRFDRGSAVAKVAHIPNAVVGDKLSQIGKSIPVYGSAVGGLDGEFDMNGSKLYEVMAPPSLNPVTGAYAVIVSGDSMEPRYFDGETVFVDPTRRPVRGNFVVAQIQYEEQGPRMAYIKRFVRHNDKELILEQYNPAKELSFPHENVVSVHVVVMGGTA